MAFSTRGYFSARSSRARDGSPSVVPRGRFCGMTCCATRRGVECAARQLQYGQCELAIPRRTLSGGLAFDGLTVSPCHRGAIARRQSISHLRSDTQFCVGASVRLSGASRVRVAAEGRATLSRLSQFAARSSNRRLVNSSAFSARLRQRSAYAFKKFASMMSPTQHVQFCTAHRLDLR